APAPTTAILTRPPSSVSTSFRPPSSVHERGQVPALHLARWTLRDRGQDRNPGRPLEGGQVIRAVGGEFPWRGPPGPVPEDDHNAYLLAVLLVRHRVGRRLGDRRMAEQHGLHLVRRDLLAGPVDQLLDAAHQGQVPVRAEPADIAGAEPAVPERGLRRGWVIEVLIDDGRATHRHLALPTGTHRPPVVSEGS